MVLSPVLLIHYSSIWDFQIRMLCFLFFVYIFNCAMANSQRKFFSLMTANPLRIWLVAFAIFSLSALVNHLQGIHLSGDEPHFLMVSQSIIEDGDFDLKNNEQEQTYKKFIPVKIRTHGIFHKDKLLSYHMPGLSFLLIPFYFLFYIFGPILPPQLYFRLSAACINAFFAMGLFLLLKMKFPKRDITGIWFLFLVTFPLIFHGIHLYPELPAATMMMMGYLFFSKNDNPLLSGLFLSLVPWFHVKYIPPLLVLAFFILYRIAGSKNLCHCIRFLLFPVISMVLLFIYSKTLYGSFNPAAIFPKLDLMSVPMLHRIKTLLAYFLDQRDGLLFYCPILLLLLVGLCKQIRDRYVFMGILIVYILGHAMATVRGAHAPAGRPLMFVSWILMLMVADFYFNRINNKPKYRFKLLAGFSIFVVIWLFYHPYFIYQPVFFYTRQKASDLLLFLGSSQMDLSLLFPSFLSASAWKHTANYLWFAVLLYAVISFHLARFKRSLSKKQ